MNIVVFDQSIETFFKSLDEKSYSRVLRAMDRLEHFGHNLGMPHSKYMHRGIFELRIYGEKALRIFYTFQGSNIVILHAFVKKSQRTPKKDLDAAIRKMKLLQNR